MFQNVSVITVLTLPLPASLQMMASFALLLVIGFRFMSWYAVQNVTDCILTHSLGTEEPLEQTSEMLLHPCLSLQCPESSWCCRFKAIKDFYRVQAFLWLNNWIVEATAVALRWAQRFLGLKAVFGTAVPFLASHHGYIKLELNVKCSARNSPLVCSYKGCVGQNLHLSSVCVPAQQLWG